MPVAECAVDPDPKDCGISEGARDVPVYRGVCVSVEMPASCKREFALLIGESLFFPAVVNLFSVDNDDR